MVGCAVQGGDSSTGLNAMQQRRGPREVTFNSHASAVWRVDTRAGKDYPIGEDGVGGWGVVVAEDGAERWVLDVYSTALVRIQASELVEENTNAYYEVASRLAACPVWNPWTHTGSVNERWTRFEGQLSSPAIYDEYLDHFSVLVSDALPLRGMLISRHCILERTSVRVSMENLTVEEAYNKLQLKVPGSSGLVECTPGPPSECALTFSDGARLYFDFSNPQQRTDLLALSERVLRNLRQVLLNCEQGQFNEPSECDSRTITTSIIVDLRTLLTTLGNAFRNIRVREDRTELCAWQGEIDAMLMRIEAGVTNPYPFDQPILEGTWGTKFDMFSSAQFFHYIIRPLHALRNAARGVCTQANISPN